MSGYLINLSESSWTTIFRQDQFQLNAPSMLDQITRDFLNAIIITEYW